jgi:chromosome segregation ATPase
MKKQTAEALGVGGLLVGGLALLDSNQKGNTIDALTAENTTLRLENADLGEALKRKTMRVSVLERERGDLLRTCDVANGKLDQANERIDGLQVQVTTTKRDLADANQRVERVHRNLVESEGARQQLHNEMATKNAEHAAELAARDAAYAAELAKLREELEFARKASQPEGEGETGS